MLWKTFSSSLVRVCWTERSQAACLPCLLVVAGGELPRLRGEERSEERLLERSLGSLSWLDTDTSTSGPAASSGSCTQHPASDSNIAIVNFSPNVLSIGVESIGCCDIDMIENKLTLYYCWLLAPPGAVLSGGRCAPGWPRPGPRCCPASSAACRAPGAGGGGGS